MCIFLLKNSYLKLLLIDLLKTEAKKPVISLQKFNIYNTFVHLSNNKNI